MALNPLLFYAAKRHQVGGSIHKINPKGMVAAAVGANDQLRNDASEIERADKFSEAIKSS